MDETDDILPEDDSVFDAVINEELLDASDAILEDSFSSIPEITSTPLVDRRRGFSPCPSQPTRSSPRRAPSATPRSPSTPASSRPSRSRAVASGSPSSPSVSTRSRARATTPAQNAESDQQSPARSTRSRVRCATPSQNPESELNSPSRSTRSRSRAAATVVSADPELDSPSRRTRSRARAATAVVSGDPDLDSQSRSTRSRARVQLITPAAESVSPSRPRTTSTASSPARPATSVSLSPSSSAGSRNTSASSRPQRNPPQRKESRIKCTECTNDFANERTFRVHKQMHLMKRVFSRAAKLEKLQADFFPLVKKTFEKLLEEKFVGKWAKPLKDYIQKIQETFNNLEEEHQELSDFLCGDLYKILSSHSSVFSSSLVLSFYMGVNKLMNQDEFVENVKKRFVVLGDAQAPEIAVLNLFVGNFMHVLMSEIVIYFIRTIHGASTSDVVRRKRSKDKIDSIEFMEMSYYIGGSVVRTFNDKGKKYSETNPNWKLFIDVLNEKFIRKAGVGNACTSEVSRFTEKVDRGKLTHISQEALDFFLVLFDFLMSLEGEDGSLPENVVEDCVLKNDTVICLWDVLVGSGLEDDVSLDFLMQMSETCKRIVIKGIMKRRLNQNLKKAVAAVSLRSRLAD